MLDGNANMADEHTELVKHTLDAVSLVTVIGALVDALPAVAALFTIVWTGIRIWESDTVQGWVRRK